MAGKRQGLNFPSNRGPSTVFKGLNPTCEDRFWVYAVGREIKSFKRHPINTLKLLPEPLSALTEKEKSDCQTYYGKRIYQLPPQIRDFDRNRRAIVDPWYDPRVKKDTNANDRLNALNARAEDAYRVIPILGNNVYGHRLNKPRVEERDRRHIRKEHAKVEPMYDVRKHMWLPVTRIQD